jgi:DNA-binding GntR family transcriptional regulator
MLLMHNVQIDTIRPMNSGALKGTPASIVPRTRAEAVAAELRRLIKTGEFAPGERLRQAKLAARFGVSTTPVREAFTALAREGLVRHDAHRGVVVFAPSLPDLRETYEMRALLEPLATELAVPCLADSAIDALRGLVVEMRTASPQRYAELNYAFHSQIYEASSRPRLLDTVAQLREAAATYLNLAVHKYDPAYRKTAQEEHEGILWAVEARASRRAAALVRHHLLHNATHFERLLANSPPAVKG